MATGRALLVHESAGTRALLAALLSREGLDVEAVESTYACMDRFVDAPADVVVVGLADMDEAELDLIPALKREERPPRVLVTFPGPRRELAVRALSKGADGYVIEPFYKDEVLGLVRGGARRPTWCSRRSMRCSAGSAHVSTEGTTVTPLEVGVIGVGHLGSLHAKMLSQIKTVHLAGVYDLDAARDRAIAEEFSTRAFDSLDGVLEHVQAITIATSTSTHYEVACRALERGLHLFIEKPITASVAEAQALLSRAREAGCVVQVGHIERFNPAILALEKYQINPLFVESHRLAQFNPRGTDVAVVLDLMIHDIDIILSFVRSAVRQVDASGVAVVSDSVDIANARLQFENGCVANVTASRISQRKMRKMRLFQPNTYISIDFSEGMAEVFRLAHDDEAPGPSTMVVRASQSLSCRSARTGP